MDFIDAVFQLRKKIRIVLKTNLRYLTIGRFISQKAEKALNQDISVDSLLIAKKNFLIR